MKVWLEKREEIRVTFQWCNRLKSSRRRRRRSMFVKGKRQTRVKCPHVNYCFCQSPWLNELLNNLWARKSCTLLSIKWPLRFSLSSSNEAIFVAILFLISCHLAPYGLTNMHKSLSARCRTSSVTRQILLRRIKFQICTHTLAVIASNEQERIACEHRIENKSRWLNFYLISFFHWSITLFSNHQRRIWTSEDIR